MNRSRSHAFPLTTGLELGHTPGMRSKSRTAEPFWKEKPLNAMTHEEWESLCDGCGICCLEKIEDEERGRTLLTAVSCEFLDTETCRCKVYDDRLRTNPECIRLVPENLEQVRGLPETCAYRCLAEGRNLPWWHHLVSGDRKTVHRAGFSVRRKVVCGRYVRPEDLAEYVLE